MNWFVICWSGEGDGMELHALTGPFATAADAVDWGVAHHRRDGHSWVQIEATAPKWSEKPVD